MSDVWDAIKLAITTALGGLITYLKPVYEPMFVLAYVFILDIIVGILVDLIKNNDRIRIKKLLIAFTFLTLYVVVLASTFVIGDKMGDQEEAFFIIKTLTYSFTYFYVSNIFRNLRKLAPNNKPIAFIDYWLGLQVVKRLPELAKYLGISNKNNDEQI